MHSYLRAVGFSKVTNRSEFEPYYHETLVNPTKKVATIVNEKTTFIQFYKEFGPNFGLSLIGEIDKDGSLSIEYYFPYVFPSHGIEIVDNNLSIQKHLDKSSYSGILDRFSSYYMFFVQNAADYQSMKFLKKASNINSLYLSAMSIDGKILLPVYKDTEEEEDIRNYSRFKADLIDLAKKGNSEAISKLYHSEIRVYNNSVSRLQNEDILTVVESFLIPAGVDCEYYQAVGVIKDFKLFMNKYTKEEIYMLQISCNNFTISLAINKKDLLGEPMIGRRFSGNIWLQGVLTTSFI